MKQSYIVAVAVVAILLIIAGLSVKFMSKKSESDGSFTNVDDLKQALDRGDDNYKDPVRVSYEKGQIYKIGEEVVIDKHSIVLNGVNCELNGSNDPKSVPFYADIQVRGYNKKVETPAITAWFVSENGSKYELPQIGNFALSLGGTDPSDGSPEDDGSMDYYFGDMNFNPTAIPKTAMNSIKYLAIQNPYTKDELMFDISGQIDFYSKK